MRSLSENHGATLVTILYELILASISCHHIPLMKDGNIKSSPAGALSREHIKKVHRARDISQKTKVVSKPHVFFIPGQIS